MISRSAFHSFNAGRRGVGTPASSSRRFARPNAGLVRSLLRKSLPVIYRRECRWAVAIVVARMATAPVVGQTPELLVNGHFESPAFSGDGDVWSSSATFSLPGWTYPTGTNQLYLEFGRPLGTWRYTDGRQAICLHGQGRPVSISQTFPTVPGQNYTLSFAQSDEANAGPSASQLTVGVAGLFRVFGNGGGYHVYDDHGYKVNAMSFTARSNITTLTFSDTSPAGVPS